MSCSTSVLSQDRLAPAPGDRPMVPVVVNGCFGWLHTGRNAMTSDTAVLVCPALNRDALDAHYSLRLLADDFAAAGYPTMRLDYPGTGDSLDVLDSGGKAGEHWSAWRQSVHDAADWLRRSTGARRLVFCGLRIGATLAALAAEDREDVAGLVLLAPVLRGHSYMRQLSTEAQLQGGSEATTGGILAFQELQLSAETVGLIGQADLRKLRLPAGQQVAVFAQAESSLLSACIQAWTRQSAAVTCAGFDGLEPLLHHNVQGEGQPADFSAVLEWVRHALPARPAAFSGARHSEGALMHPGWVETPLFFGANEQLFGMLCRPDRAKTDMAVIIANTGVDPHYGFARFGVEFARCLAAAGIASLRIDFAGLGDSAGRPGKERFVSSLFETDRVCDIVAAIDGLERRGYRRFTIQGLCSGAYHALHGALADPRLETLVLVNMPVFKWRTGDTVDFVGHKHAPSGYLVKLWQKETWKQLLGGKLDVRGIVRAQGERLYECTGTVARQAAGGIGLPVRQSFPHTAMASLSERHARVLFIYGAADGGLDVLEQNFGKGGAGLRRFDGVTLRVVQDLDHSLSSRPMRRTATDLMLGFLQADAGAVPGAS